MSDSYKVWNIKWKLLYAIERNDCNPQKQVDLVVMLNCGLNLHWEAEEVEWGGCGICQMWEFESLFDWIQCARKATYWTRSGGIQLFSILRDKFDNLLWIWLELKIDVLKSIHCYFPCWIFFLLQITFFIWIQLLILFGFLFSSITSNPSKVSQAQLKFWTQGQIS